MTTAKCVFVRPSNYFLLRFRTTSPAPGFIVPPFPSICAAVIQYAALTGPVPSTFAVPARLIATATLKSHPPTLFPAKSDIRETGSAML